MRDARELLPAAGLASHGFELRAAPSAVDFADEAEVVSAYYGEVAELVLAATGCADVHVFDHTVRKSGVTNLNALDGGAAAPVPRVHCDYTHDGAPRRLRLLAEGGMRSHKLGRVLTEAEGLALLEGRFAFVNVWRSIDAGGPPRPRAPTPYVPQ